MKISFTGLKVSIAGAKLSHLVRKDKIWDHGSMTEQVKNIFYQVEKAKNRRDADLVRKYVTPSRFEKLKGDIQDAAALRSISKNAVITEISIIHVRPGKRQKPDGFRALVRGKRKTSEELIAIGTGNYGIENFSEEWFFIRQGEWWLLDGIKA